MKKNLFLFLCLIMGAFSAFAGKFVLIPVSPTNNLETLFSNNDLKIHYYCDDYVLATTDNLNFEEIAVLDEDAFANNKTYAIVYCKNDHKDEYINNIAKSAKNLFSGEHFFIMQILSNEFYPAKNDGMVAITNTEARLPRSVVSYPVFTDPDDNVLNCISQVNTTNVMGYIQTLQNFDTRHCRHANHILARNWIKQQYDAMDLEVSLHNFSWYLGNNDNVIAIQYGTDPELKDEYIVLGCHYDSYTYESQDNAPGADDNASGTAGIMETARILSQYNFKRSIIYCSFSAEEYGLYGSNAYAQKCQNEGMNILGYFNLDMIGYLKEGAIRFSLIYPGNALILANYFVNVCDVYFPTVPVSRHANLSWGDSDHTSFNQKGYKGIWWFEDVDCDSPYIHHIPGGYGCGDYVPCFGGVIPCLGDIIGPSVNNSEQVTVFTQAMVASIATLAEFDGETPPPLSPPTHCKAEYVEDMNIKVTWEAPTANTPDVYYVFRDEVKINETVALTYLDTVADYSIYCYTVKAVYEEDMSDNSNQSCASVPSPWLPPTNCLAKWVIEEANINNNIAVIWDAPAEETPTGYIVYRDDVEIAQTEEIHYLDTLETTGDYCYKIKAVYDEGVSDFSNESCDNIPIIDVIKEFNSKFIVYPNPAKNELRIMNYELRDGEIEIFDINGRKQPFNPSSFNPSTLQSLNSSIPQSFNPSILILNISHLTPGIYFLKIVNEFVVKFVKE